MSLFCRGRTDENGQQAKAVQPMGGFRQKFRNLKPEECDGTSLVLCHKTPQTPHGVEHCILGESRKGQVRSTACSDARRDEWVRQRLRVHAGV